MTVALKDYTLFKPYQLSKNLELKNRIVMSPLTRARCDPVTHEAGPMQVECYSQRAGAGLIVTEAVAVSVQSFGWYGAPCMYTVRHALARPSRLHRLLREQLGLVVMES